MGCGGGGGGILILASDGPIVISPSANITVAGGSGHAGNTPTGLAYGGGGGGGGLIHIISPNANSTTDIPNSALHVEGGAAGQTFGSGSPITNGFGGGASAGYGGIGGSQFGGAPAAGGAGLIVRTQTTNAASLLGVR